VSEGRASAALTTAPAATLLSPLFIYYTSPSPLRLPPSYRVMELPTQKQDTLYKWDAEGEKLFLPTESYCLGIAKLQSWQTQALVHW